MCIAKNEVLMKRTLKSHASKYVDPIQPQVTYADLAIAVLLQTLTANKSDLLDNFPTLAKLKTSVEQLPAIDKWIKGRPETHY